MHRRNFLKSTSMAVAALSTPALARTALAAEEKAAAMPSKSYPPLTGPFRLPPEWYQRTMARFQEKLRAQKLDAAVVTGADNINYLTGSFAITTERPVWLMIWAEGDPMLFHPGLDRELWGSWWVKDRSWYFDYPHHGPLNQLTWTAGARADLFAEAMRWFMQGRRGALKVGFIRGGSPDITEVSKLPVKVTPDWGFTETALLHMRMGTTAEELALARVALALHDRMLDFARDFILTHGANATDFEVSQATSSFGGNELARYLPLDGRPHTGVGVNVNFECRTGVATAYPHPNQFFHARIQRGDAIQISAGVRIGGYGGEGYRAMQIAGPRVTPLHHKMWDVHTAMTLEQQKLMKAGTPCNQVGAGVLKLAKDAGLEKYVFHRPAHGEGSEGHQAPYLALGDETILEENMTFSNEPGLYSAEDGFGYNHSNFVRVTPTGGEQMNQTPLTKEWCWIRI